MRHQSPKIWYFSNVVDDAVVVVAVVVVVVVDKLKTIPSPQGESALG